MTWFFLIQSLWVVSAVLLGIMPVIMFKRGWHRELPVFFSYLIFHAVQSWILLLIHRFFHDSYSFSYWSFELVDAALGFAVIYEIFSHIVRPYPSLRKIAILLFRWTSVVLVVIAGVSAGVAQGNDSMRFVAGILAWQRCVYVIQCGLLFYLFIFASSLGLTWRHHVFGIAFGFGLCASVELVALTMRAYFGDLDHSVYSIIKPVNYDCAVLIWMGYLVTAKESVSPPQREPRHDGELELWDNVLTELLYNK